MAHHHLDIATNMCRSTVYVCVALLCAAPVHAQYPKPDPWKGVYDLLKEGVEKTAFPGAVGVVSTFGATPFFSAVGKHTYNETSTPVSALNACFSGDGFVTGFVTACYTYWILCRAFTDGLRHAV